MILAPNSQELTIDAFEPKALGPLPPVAIYPTLQARIAAAKGHARAYGYDVFIQCSSPDRVCLNCDRGVY